MPSRVYRASLLWVSLLFAAGCSERPVEVTPDVRLTSLTVSPASVNLPAGERAPLRAEGRDATGALVTSPALTWRSDAPAVATVDAKGLVLRRRARCGTHYRQCHG
ncbi:Ig-like domain-containing protein [Gemmatimonas sp.]|uniref:Ig-like domain-containing protein n=1 Tax=Gemmatimonas sp. TaxID=1962908 RepID=UPI003DA57E19